MNKEIIAQDINGVKRCYGIGRTFQEAIQECIKASEKYLTNRPDITELYLYYESGRPVVDAARYETWTVTAKG